MIKTKTIIGTIGDVPNTWAFEYYLKLPEKLSGQDMFIKSVFSPTDTNPSFSVYWHSTLNRYQFKDFSSGHGGSHIDLVSAMYNISQGEAMCKIVQDYSVYILDNKGLYTSEEFKEHSKYKVTRFTKRKWNLLDKEYWGKYRIGSKLLERYNVAPLEDYTLEKEEEEVQKILIKGYNIYGYFRADGTIYKIYQPFVPDRKFLKLGKYIQGTDQLDYKNKLLVITSSLKDLMCLINTGWSLEAVAPDSENTLIREHIIMAYKHKYKKIITLLDNDEAGIRAMKKYKELYDIPYIHLQGEKDLSDNINKLGKKETETLLHKLIREKIKPKQELV